MGPHNAAFGMSLILHVLAVSCFEELLFSRPPPPDLCYRYGTYDVSHKGTSGRHGLGSGGDDVGGAAVCCGAAVPLG